MNKYMIISGGRVDLQSLQGLMDRHMGCYDNCGNYNDLENKLISILGDKNIKFNLNIADDIPYELIGDKGKIKEIVNNLLTNAIKYTNEGDINLNIKCINNIKKNISNIIIFMTWVYIISYIFVIGIGINANDYLEEINSDN